MTATSPDVIHGFHSHVYFDDATFEPAKALCEAASERFDVKMGRMHRGPVGPHPVGSCQLAYSPALLGDVLAWLALNRNGLTEFTHAETGDDLVDHTEHVIWLGESVALNLDLFRKPEAENKPEAEKR